MGASHIDHARVCVVYAKFQTFLLNVCWWRRGQKCSSQHKMGVSNGAECQYMFARTRPITWRYSRNTHTHTYNGSFAYILYMVNGGINGKNIFIVLRNISVRVCPSSYTSLNIFHLLRMVANSSAVLLDAMRVIFGMRSLAFLVICIACAISWCNGTYGHLLLFMG